MQRNSLASLSWETVHLASSLTLCGIHWVTMTPADVLAEEAYLIKTHPQCMPNVWQAGALPLRTHNDDDLADMEPPQRCTKCPAHQHISPSHHACLVLPAADDRALYQSVSSMPDLALWHISAPFLYLVPGKWIDGPPVLIIAVGLDRPDLLEAVDCRFEHAYLVNTGAIVSIIPPDPCLTSSLHTTHATVLDHHWIHQPDFGVPLKANREWQPCGDCCPAESRLHS